MEFLYFLESIRIPWLDSVVLALTELGGETVFLAAALVLFWCVDKRQAYYMMSVGFIGTIFSQFMKIMCRIPRPWVRDPGFTIVEAAREGAGGYSFPSGHSQSSVGTFGALAATAKNRWLKVFSICACVFVPLTRMYLGVHTPADVLVGSGISLVLLALLYPVFYRSDGKYIPILFIGMSVLAVVYTLFIEFFPFPADIDGENLYSAGKNAYTLLGAMVGMTAVYFYDEKKLRFSTKGVWYVQLLKVAGGLILVLAIKEGMKAPINTLCGGHLIGRSIRYCLTVLVAGIVWPLNFPRFAAIGRKESK